jgi:ParB-like chromosome segregation protein Spo0J
MYEGRRHDLYLVVGPGGKGEASALLSASLSEARLVQITQLSFGYTPRRSPLDEEHVNSLVEVVDQVPPIIVDECTLMVIDGLHRTEAARRAGREELRAVLFSGSGVDAVALAISANLRDGKPLTRYERRAAASMLLKRVPQRSDRWVGEVCGMSHTTIARVRETTSAAALPVRIGRDGRSRPIDGVPGQAAVAKALASNPGGSIRRVARLAGVAPNTARRVATKLARPEDPGSDPLLTQGPTEEEPLIDLTRLSGPQGDINWWERTAVFPGDLSAHFGELPIAELSDLIDECRRRAHTWHSIAEALEQRNEKSMSRVQTQV